MMIVLVTICCWFGSQGLVKNLKFVQTLSKKFGQDFAVQVLWRGWCLVEILKMKLDQDLCLNLWSEINRWVRCAFGNVYINRLTCIHILFQNCIFRIEINRKCSYKQCHWLLRTAWFIPVHRNFHFLFWSLLFGLLKRQHVAPLFKQVRADSPSWWWSSLSPPSFF